MLAYESQGFSPELRVQADSKCFDLWADGYDKSVNLSEESNEYPFAGYKEVLNTIYNQAREKENSKILDIGFGTGILTHSYIKQVVPL